MNGDRDRMDAATVRSLRVIADDVDEIRDIIHTASNRLVVIAGSIFVSLVSTGIAVIIRVG